jgi:F-type H+-transporting ATPase subunit epsilon
MADASNNSGLLTVRLVTPDRLLLEATAAAVELPSASGYMEALYGAAPLLAELGAGEVRLHGGSSGEQKFFVAWGFVEVLPERVTILAETALKPEEIDTAEAHKDLEHGQKMWNEAGDDAAKYDYAVAEMREAEEKLVSAEGKPSL